VARDKGRDYLVARHRFGIMNNFRRPAG
jgi:hypothetical protein